MTAREQNEIICTCICRQTELYGEWARCHGMSYNTMMTLYALDLRDGVTQKEITEGWLLPKQTVHTVVKELERRGYVRLDNFYSGAASSLSREVQSLMDQGATSLVLDVRSNPGGYVAELIAALDYLLPEGPVFTERPRWGKETVYESDASCVDLPMVVMVDANSYSAAELFAAQLRESVQAPIVGEVTSGKGYAQLTFPLVNGGGLGLSVSAYCTGGGHSLIGEGIQPDVELSLDDSGTDNQWQAAIDLLLK